MALMQNLMLGRGGVDVEIGREEQRELLTEALRPVIGSSRRRRVLVLAPDMSRLDSGAGVLTSIIHDLLTGPAAEVDILPTVGTHRPMSDAELGRMYGGIPKERFHVHDWRGGTKLLGDIPRELIEAVSEGRLHYTIRAEINRLVLEGDYDLILSVGQVVPHEVIGMANHAKNLLIGAGGKDMIDKSHFLGAVFGMERIMGRIETPVRRVIDWAAERFLGGLPLFYVQSVMDRSEAGKLVMRGLFIGEGREPFVEAARLSRKVNINLLDRPIEQAVVYLDPKKYKATWLGAKAVYRLRMAMADGGELMILAPGLAAFGEDARFDALIRRFGYRGTDEILRWVDRDEDLRDNLAAAAHLIHGSSEGRFRIVYAPGLLTREEIEGVGCDWADLSQALARYGPDRMSDGFNDVSGEKVFFVRDPGQGLWALRNHFADESRV